MTAEPYTREARWYLGALNDGLFIIDRPPSPDGNDLPPDFAATAEPTVVLSVTSLARRQAQNIVDAHNATVEAAWAEIEVAVKGHQRVCQGYARDLESKDKEIARLKEADIANQTVLRDQHDEIARLRVFGENYADHDSACPVLDEETPYSRECDCGYEAEWRVLYRPAISHGDAAENKEEGNAD